MIELPTTLTHKCFLLKASEHNFVKREGYHLNSAIHFKCKNTSFLEFSQDVNHLVLWRFQIPSPPPPFCWRRENWWSRSAEGPEPVVLSESIVITLCLLFQGQPSQGWGQGVVSKQNVQTWLPGQGLLVEEEGGLVLYLLSLPICDLTMCW